MGYIPTTDGTHVDDGLGGYRPKEGAETGTHSWGEVSTYYTYAIYNYIRVTIQELPDITPPVIQSTATISPASRIVISNVTSSSMTMTWNKAIDDFAPGSELYSVYYSTELSDMDSATLVQQNAVLVHDWFADLGDTNGNISRAITGLTQGTTYYVMVLIKDSRNNTRRYTVKTSPTNNTLAPVVTPNYALTYTGLTNSKTTISWTAATGTGIEYALYRSGSNTMDTVAITDGLTPVFNWQSAATSYEDTTLSDGTTYWYTVVARYMDMSETYHKSIYNQSSVKSGSRSTGAATKNSITLNFTRGFDGASLDADLRVHIGHKRSFESTYLYQNDWSLSYITTATITGLDGNTAYDFIVEMKRFDGTPYVTYDVISRSTLAPLYPPADKSITVTNTGIAQQVTITWQPAQTWDSGFNYNTISYQVYTSSTNNIGSVSSITDGDLLGSIVEPGTAAPSLTAVTLPYSTGNTCYVNILVTDSYNNSKDVYTMRAVTVP